MGIFSLIILGLAAGILAKWLMPGKHSGGFVLTALLGIAGAFIGSYGAYYMGFEQVRGLNWQSLVAATIGSFVLLYLADILTGQTDS